jgi:hypothetical protein
LTSNPAGRIPTNDAVAVLAAVMPTCHSGAPRRSKDWTWPGFLRASSIVSMGITAARSSAGANRCSTAAIASMISDR